MQRAFRDLVLRTSEDDPSKLRGGDFGFLDATSRALPAPVIQAALALKEVGDVSRPVRSEGRWYVLELTQRLPGVKRTLDQVRPVIQQRLLRQSREKLTARLMAEVRARADVHIDEEALAGVSLGPTVKPR